MADETLNPITALRHQLNSGITEFKRALPPQIPPERFARIALTAVQQTPELAVVERRSLFNALMRCASDGLVPDGRQAAIIPFKDKAVYMPMIAGMLARFRNSGQFKQVSTNVVRTGEPFRHWIDEHGEHVMHEPGEDESAPIIKAYAIAVTKDGGFAMRVMSREAIEKRRAVSRAKDGPMWREWYAEACQKTVLRNLMKLLPSSSDDIDRMARTDDDDAIGFGSDPFPLAPAEPRERITSVASALAEFGGGNPAAAENAKPLNADHSPVTEPEATPTQPSQDPIEESVEQAERMLADQRDAIEAAFELGAQHRRDGVQRRAVPPIFRSQKREAEANAWREGWDNEKGSGLI